MLGPTARIAAKIWGAVAEWIPFFFVVWCVRRWWRTCTISFEKVACSSKTLKFQARPSAFWTTTAVSSANALAFAVCMLFLIVLSRLSVTRT